MAGSTERKVLSTHRRAHHEYLAGEAPEVHVGQPKPKADEPKKKRAPVPDPGLKQSDVTEFNLAAEPAAVDYLADYIRTKGSPTFNTACALVALELNVNIETAKRYLRKYSVDHPKAKFVIQDGYVHNRKS